MEKSELVSQVLEASAGRASDMTHALCSLGDGDMGAGIMALWTAGKKSGIILGASLTSMIFSLGIGIGVLLLHKHYPKKLEENECETEGVSLESAATVQIKSI